VELSPEGAHPGAGGHHIKALIQRVKEASVTVDGAKCGSIGRGYLVFLGVRKGETAATAVELARKVAGLRIMSDSDGKMNLGLAETEGAVLVVSQMTLYGDCSKGRRPSFEAVAPGAEAGPVYEAFVAALKAAGVRTETGVFGARMDVALVNDGPVTFMVEI